VVTLLVVVGVIVLPSLLSGGEASYDVGVTGAAPEGLEQTLVAYGEGVGTTLRVQAFDTLAAGEEAVREREVDVLVSNGDQLSWRGPVDDALRAVVVGAIQIATVQGRAAAAGMGSAALQDLLEPVPVTDVQLGSAPGRTRDDETAAMLMTVLLFIAITTYGNLVLAGVVEEKASRVVEVLLARMPARSLLAGKVAGIGLLGLAQFAVTALLALVAVLVVDTVDVPAVRAGVLFWVVVWFVLGYALYAVVYGSLGSLASRTEDAQTVAGPVTGVLIAAYFVSFAAIGSADSTLAVVASLVPLTAPLVVPSLVAMGTAAWWQPVVAAVLTVATIAVLVRVGGRVYTRAILHTGPTLKLREAWRAGRSGGG